MGCGGVRMGGWRAGLRLYFLRMLMNVYDVWSDRFYFCRNLGEMHVGGWTIEILANKMQ